MSGIIEDAPSPEKHVYINGEKSKYIVTKTGKIYKINKNGKRKPMKHFIDKDGYHAVGLHLNGKSYYRRVHRLVAEAFIPNPECKPEVNHKDGNKNNNRMRNLEWVTTKENICHAWNTGLAKASRGERHPNSIYTEKQVRRICELIEDNAMTMPEISNTLNIPYTIVKQIRHRILWKHVSKEYDFSNYTKSARNHKK